MRSAEGFFDEIHFTECNLLAPTIAGDTLSISASGLYVFPEHPLAQSGPGPHEGTLVFDGVSSSRRVIIEYIGDSMNPEGFKDPRTVIDAFPANRDPGESSGIAHVFEGYLAEPSSWVDHWEVTARSFKIVLR